MRGPVGRRGFRIGESGGVGYPPRPRFIAPPRRIDNAPRLPPDAGGGRGPRGNAGGAPPPRRGIERGERFGERPAGFGGNAGGNPIGGNPPPFDWLLSGPSEYP